MSPLLGSFHSELKFRCAKVSAVAFAIHEKNGVFVLEIQLEQLLVFEVVRQRVIEGVYIVCSEGPAFAHLFLAGFERSP